MPNSDTDTSQLLKDQILQIKRDIDRELALFFDHKIAEAGRIDTQYKRLLNETKKLALRGGKRLRPFMVWLGWQLGGGKERQYDQCIQLGLAWEVYHVSALILDDVMDRDTHRHGGLNINGVYEKALRRSHTPEEASQHGVNAAIMSGVGTMYLSLEVLRSIQVEPELLIQLEDHFLKMHFRLVGGQFLEDQAVLARSLKPRQIRQIYLHKSASYSLISPLQSGAMLASANRTILDVLDTYGQHAGVAFQIVDDLLGVFGSSRQIGKTNTSDIEEGKKTLLMHYGYTFADATQKTILDKFVGKANLTAVELKQVRRVLTENGAKAKTMFIAQAEARAAKHAFGKLALPGNLPELFSAVTDYLVERSK